jgi:hypothetical protein
VVDRISTRTLPARRIEELPPDRWRELRRAGDAAPNCPQSSPGLAITTDEREAARNSAAVTTCSSRW